MNLYLFTFIYILHFHRGIRHIYMKDCLSQSKINKTNLKNKSKAPEYKKVLNAVLNKECINKEIIVECNINFQFYSRSLFQICHVSLYSKRYKFEKLKSKPLIWFFGGVITTSGIEIRGKQSCE